MSAGKVAPIPLSDERIDFIAETVIKGMPDGIRGFCNTWGWRQFARAILQDCAGHYAEPTPVSKAAPALLEALQLAVKLLRTHTDPECLGGERFDLTDCNDMRPIFAAIAAATGEQQ